MSTNKNNTTTNIMGGNCPISTVVELNRAYETAISDMTAFAKNDDPDALLIRAGLLLATIQHDLNNIADEGVSSVLHIAEQAATMVYAVMQDCRNANYVDVVAAEKTAKKFLGLNRS